MITHHRHAVAVTLTATGLLLAGCSNASSPTHANTAYADGRSTSSSSAASPSATAATTSGSSCGLVTPSEVSAATGKSMGQGADAGTICSYSATTDPSTVAYVQLYTDAQSMGAAKAIEPDSQHLPGVGDDAFWTAAGTVFAQKGSRGFTISIPGLALTSPSAPQSMVALATIAASRL
jgi:hypothetical protein